MFQQVAWPLAVSQNWDGFNFTVEEYSQAPEASTWELTMNAADSTDVSYQGYRCSWSVKKVYVMCSGEEGV